MCKNKKTLQAFLDSLVEDRLQIILALTAAMRWNAVSLKEEMRIEDSDNVIVLSDLMKSLIQLSA